MFRKCGPNEQMQYTMAAKKVMRLYVYCGLPAVKLFGCIADGWRGSALKE